MPLAARGKVGKCITVCEEKENKGLLHPHTRSANQYKAKKRVHGYRCRSSQVVKVAASVVVDSGV
jgi:hypothetical protein